MKILELNLLTQKIDEQKSFYTGKLGFELIDESKGSFTIDCGTSKLTFTDDANTAENCYHFAFNIPENQLNEAAHWLKGSVPLIQYNNSPIINFPNWNAHSLYFYDASGNVVELIARHNLKNASENPFSAKSIINISEAGMPARSVKNFYNELNNNFDLNLWWGNLETFAAVGDEEGLFIVVTTQRNWFPTSKPCNIYPLKAKIEGPENKILAFENNNYEITCIS